MKKLYDFTDMMRWYLCICLIGISVFLMCSCHGPKYSKGDMVYVKPDSTEAVVNDTYPGPKYEVKYELLLDSIKPILVSEEAIL